MSSFSTSHLEKRVKALTMSQQSIQTLSLWCIHHRKSAKIIVKHWLKDLLKAKVKKKLALMYLANDVLQNSRKKGTEFNQEFRIVMLGAVNHCIHTADDKLANALKRMHGIWTERNVFEEDFLSTIQQAIGGGEKQDASTTPPLDQMPIDESEFMMTTTDELATATTVAPIHPPDHPPDPDELVLRLQELEHSATQDAVVREQIANLPTEVTDPTYIDKVEDLESARRLQEKINSACELLQEYNTRLSVEQVDREQTRKMLLDYTTMQRYQISQTENKIDEYLGKLEKVKAVRKELKLHLQNLPDLTKLPSPVPLPSAGDLFATRR
eukprot:TCONS_00061282-protein